MLTFRKKIFITYTVLFLLFLLLLFPFSQRFAERIVADSMEKRTEDIIQKIQNATTDNGLIHELKEQKHSLYFRVSLISNDRRLLYDTHSKRLLGPKFAQEYLVDHKEVIEAFEKGVGFNEDYSDFLAQRFIYLAKAFDFQGTTYVVRTAFPYMYAKEIEREFIIGFTFLSVIVLFFFSIMTWLIINYLTRPIQQVIETVKPYQEGRLKVVPKIEIHSGDEKDEFHQLAATLNDLSFKLEQKIQNLREERNAKEALLEGLIEGVIAVDSQGKITYSNQMARVMINKDLQSWVFSTLVSEMIRECQRNSGAIKKESQLETPLSTRYVDIVAVPITKEGGVVVVIQDKTSDRKMVEMRKDFIANASHELKTPITIIHGFAETLHDNPDLSQEVLLTVTSKIVKNCERMTNLIQDLLALADIERLPQSRFKKCDLYEIIEKSISFVQEIYPQASIKLKKSAKQPILLADPGLVEQLITNLVENGAKYSTSPAHIELTVEEHKKTLSIYIQDHGIGIPQDSLESIFERFYTVDKMRSKKLGGSGLGLSIVKTIVEKHKGTITVSSVVGEGSLFTIELPKACDLSEFTLD